MYPLIPLFSKLSKRIPLRAILVVPFVIQISLAVGLVGWLSIQNGNRSVNEVASQLRSETTSRIHQYLKTYIATPQTINQLNRNAVQLKQLDFHNLPELEYYLWRQIQVFDLANEIKFGTPQGEFVAVERLDDNSFSGKMSSKATGYINKVYSLAPTGEPTKLLLQRRNFDPRTRPWYKAAIKAGRATWGEIYKRPSTPKPVIPFSVPIYDSEHNLVCVASVDFSLSGISKYLNSIKIGRSGETFIVDSTGLLIGSSTTQPIFNIQGQHVQRFRAIDSQYTLTRSAAQSLLEHFGNFAAVTNTQRLSFEINGRQQFLQITPLQDDLGLDWRIVVVIPESDFMARLNANTHTTILLCLAAFGVATGLGIFTARWITQPILKLSQASIAISQGDLDQKVCVQGSVEVNILAQSFNQMAQQLQESFTQLATTNEQLELRVAQRTKALQASEAKAEVANRAKSQFLSHMSHELRTPLNVILGFTQLMLRNGSLTTEQQDYMSTITTSGEHLLTLINDVLEMSKIEAGKIVLNETTCDLYELLNWIYQTLNLKAQAKRLEMIVERAVDLPQFIRIDESKLRQVLMNLLGNAIKFTRSGKVILRVKIDNREEHPKPCYYLVFEVEDTGVGICAAELETLFKPFVQTKTGRYSHEGTGLGLYISQQLVQLMGGQITVKSQLELGTVFQFKIPVIAANEIPLPASRLQMIGLEAGQPSYRILVVEDHLKNRQLLVELLSSVGFHVREAENGHQAINLCKSWSPHLIWMDIRMPVLDGLAATQQIKADNSPSIPVIIAITSSAFEEDRIAALSAGYDDFVRKPIRADTIFDKMAEHLGVRYRYAEAFNNQTAEDHSSRISSDLTSLNVADLPTQWLEQLREAATNVNAKQILHLLKQLSPSQADLVKAISYLVDNFQFDEVVRWTQQRLGSSRK